MQPITYYATSSRVQKLQFTKEQVVDNFINTEYNLVEIEWLLNDMIKHYIRPTNDWNLSPARIAEVLENSEVVMDLVRGLMIQNRNKHPHSGE